MNDLLKAALAATALLAPLSALVAAPAPAAPAAPAFEPTRFSVLVEGKEFSCRTSPKSSWPGP